MTLIRAYTRYILRGNRTVPVATPYERATVRCSSLDMSNRRTTTTAEYPCLEAALDAAKEAARLGCSTSRWTVFADDNVVWDSPGRNPIRARAGL